MSSLCKCGNSQMNWPHHEEWIDDGKIHRRDKCVPVADIIVEYRKEIEKFRSLLLKYGNHHYDCTSTNCTCGWDKTRRWAMGDTKKNSRITETTKMREQGLSKLERESPCRNRPDGKHYYKTDCSYGPQFCMYCGLGAP